MENSSVYSEQMSCKSIFSELDPIFYPRSIAIIGASGKVGKVGQVFMSRFVESRFQELYAVNPRETEIMGVKSYPRLGDIPHQVDFAIVLTPTDSALQAVADCAAKGVKTIVITTSGFAETGARGRELQQEMVRVAGSSGCRVIGPNCVGVYCPSSRMPFPLGPGMEAGSVGLVSQSGFFADYVTYRATANGIAFSKAISCGNEADLTATDFMEYLGEDPHTEMIVAYVEGAKDGRRFFHACKEISKRKPIILWKGGITENGARAAVSHTGAMAGSRAIWEGALKQAGVVSVDSFEEVLECLRLFRLQPLPKGKRVGIASAPGGTAVATTDACLQLGLEVPHLSDRTMERLRQAMPPVGGSIDNPVDLSFASLVNPRIHGDAVRTLAEGDDVDMILLIAVSRGELLRDIVIEATAGLDVAKPLAVALMSGDDESLGRDIPMLLSHGITVYSDPSRAVHAFSRLWEYARFHTGAQDAGRGETRPAAVPHLAVHLIENAVREGRKVLSEHESKQILSAYGIPVTREREVRAEREFAEALGDIGFPLVIKGTSSGLAHKTERGLVYLDVRNETEARAAYKEITVKLKGEDPGLLVQEMVRRGRELMVGLSRDGQFGPCVVFGLGGIFTEILKDTVFRVAPLDRREALDMIDDIRGRAMLAPFRGMEAADLEQLADILIRVAAIGLNHPEIKEIDVNPLILSRATFVAADALIALDCPPSQA